jgi:calcineurin-like phosphoesterase family protein
VTDIWVIADHHFGWFNGITKFKRPDGRPIRDFKDVQEMNEYMIEQHNKVVKPQDHVYFLGDFSINQYGLLYAKRMNGHKRLVRGNHDIFKTKKYIEVGFEEIYGVRVFSEHKMILSHYPIHPSSLKNEWKCIHGHSHINNMLDETGQPDKRYINVCVEQVNYTPVLLLK